MVDMLKKTVVKTTVEVQTSNKTDSVVVFGKPTQLNIRQMVRLTVRGRCVDRSPTEFEQEILDNNFIIKDYKTHSVMYSCNVYDFMKIAKPFKQIS